MAIQVRRGDYEKFDPSRLVAGEPAAVLRGDPIATDGRAAYFCFSPGVVKRLYTYEDAQDYLSSIKEETVDWIVNTANAGFKAEYEAIRDDAKAAEEERKASEAVRKDSEKARVSAETERAEAEASRSAAETERADYYRAIKAGVDAGDFDGATFTPVVDELGNISWTNDKGLRNPLTVNIKGEKGNDGVVTQLAAAMYALQIEGTDLMLVYGDEADVPDLGIEQDGCLYLSVEG